MRLNFHDFKQIASVYKKALLAEAAPRQGTQTAPAETASNIVQQAKSQIAAINTSTPNIEPDPDELLSGTGGDIEQYLDTDLPVYSYKTLAMYLEFAYNSKDPLLIYGDPGLGKSDIVRQFATNVAQSKNKTFVNWSKATDEQKHDILQSPESYFVLIDVRTAQLEPSDLVGIPNINSKKPYLETQQPKWIYLMSLRGSDGVLFLDELNQGHPQVLKALYEVVLDRSAAGTPFSDEFCIIGAGNLGAEHGNEPIPQALTNRFTAGVLIADPDSWLEWAQAHNIDKYIIAFVKSNPSENFYVKPKNPDDPFPTPRQMAKLSTALKKIYQTYHAAKTSGKSLGVPILKAIGDAAAARCGVYWGRKFVNFVKYIQSFDVRDLIANAERLTGEAADKLHALVTFMVGRLKTIAPKIPNGVIAAEDETSNQIIQALGYITIYLKRDWRVIFWSSLKNTLVPQEFRSIAIALVSFSKVADPEVKTKLQKALADIKELLA